ncbi:MAG TPA: hypothetical protein VFD03_00090 [Clostridia bacterium]|nr:hypothetical protein [Clostridia bacterium]
MANTGKGTKEIDNFVALITWLTKPNHEEIEVVRAFVEQKGVRALFMSVTSLPITKELETKLIDLKNIIIAYDGDISEGGE